MESASGDGATRSQHSVEVDLELDGWVLFWALVERQRGGEPELAHLRSAVAADVRARFQLSTLASHPTVAALRRLFRAAGCDPTRYRPSSEALIRRLLKGEELPAISPLVDLNNCLSARLAVPCCVMADGTCSPPFRFRAGRPGESYESLRGPFKLEGKPLLCDAAGPCDAPITGSRRVKVTQATRTATLVAYLPGEATAPGRAGGVLEELVRVAPVASIRGAEEIGRRRSGGQSSGG